MYIRNKRGPSYRTLRNPSFGGSGGCDGDGDGDDDDDDDDDDNMFIVLNPKELRGYYISFHILGTVA